MLLFFPEMEFLVIQNGMRLKTACKYTFVHNSVIFDFQVSDAG